MTKRPLRKFLNPQNIDSQLMCIICREVFDDPHQVCCGHSFCFLCISIWQTARKSCPLCRKSITLRQPIKNLVLSQIISKMPCQCCYDQCQWTGLYSSLKRHQKKCQLKVKKEPLNLNSHQLVEVSSQRQRIQMEAKDNDEQEKMDLSQNNHSESFLWRIFNSWLQNQTFSSLKNQMRESQNNQATINRGIYNHHIDPEDQQKQHQDQESSSMLQSEWDKLQLINRPYPTTRNEDTENQSLEIAESSDQKINPQPEIIQIDSQSQLVESQDYMQEQQSSEKSQLLDVNERKPRKNRVAGRKNSLRKLKNVKNKKVETKKTKKHPPTKKSKPIQKPYPVFIELISETD